MPYSVEETIRELEELLKEYKEQAPDENIDVQYFNKGVVVGISKALYRLKMDFGYLEKKKMDS